MTIFHGCAQADRCVMDRRCEGYLDCGLIVEDQAGKLSRRDFDDVRPDGLVAHHDDDAAATDGPAWPAPACPIGGRTVNAQSDVLQAGLLAAVPLRMMQLRGMGARERAETVTRWAAAAVEPIASRGDALQYGGRKGQAADVFNHLARGLAALAQAPGGVLFAGVHWCVEHQGGILRETSVGLTCSAAGVDVDQAVTVVEDRAVVTVRLDGVS